MDIGDDDLWRGGVDGHAINIGRNGETPARTFEDRLKGLEATALLPLPQPARRL